VADSGARTAGLDTTPRDRKDSTRASKRQEDAALRDFDLAYGRFGSKADMNLENRAS
jgi:hypothetical protein